MNEQNATNPASASKMAIKKAEAIKLWELTNGNISQISKALSIDRRTFYNWLKDEEFTEALKENDTLLNYSVENKLIEKALNGNLHAIKFFLEHRHPEYKSQLSPDEELKETKYIVVTRGN